MISEPENRSPRVTLHLLNDLKGKVNDPLLKKQIIETINEVSEASGQAKPSA